MRKCSIRIPGLLSESLSSVQGSLGFLEMTLIFSPFWEFSPLEAQPSPFPPFYQSKKSSFHDLSLFSFRSHSFYASEPMHSKSSSQAPELISAADPSGDACPDLSRGLFLFLHLRGCLSRCLRGGTGVAALWGAVTHLLFNPLSVTGADFRRSARPLLTSLTTLFSGCFYLFSVLPYQQKEVGLAGGVI